MVHHVIIGAGPAGLAAAWEISKDCTSNLKIISHEGTKPYARSVLPLFLNSYEQKEHLFKESLAKTEYLPTEVTKINCQKKYLETKDGRVSFDKLLIATGSATIKLDLPGSKLQGISYMWQLKDLDDTVHNLKKAQDITVIGGGLISIKLAEALAGSGQNVTIVERESNLLPKLLSPELAEDLKKQIQKKGINVLCGAEVEAFSGTNGCVQEIILKNGRLKTNAVIVSVGTKPNISFLEESEINFVKGVGVYVNSNMQTNINDVYAAGDVAVITDAVSKETSRSAYWSLAVKTGKIAALNMLKSNIVLNEIVNQSGAFLGDYGVVSLGRTKISNSKRVSLIGENFKAIFSYHNECLIGVEAVGHNLKPGYWKFLILNQIPIRPDALIEGRKIYR